MAGEVFVSAPMEKNTLRGMVAMVVLHLHVMEEKKSLATNGRMINGNTEK